MNYKPKPRNYYTVYLAKNDEIIASGFANECAEQMRMTLQCFYSTVSKSINKKRKKYFIIVDKIYD